MSEFRLTLDTIEHWLRDLCPHGHPDFVSMVLEEAILYSAKNKDYTQGGDPLGNFNRVSAILKLYPGPKDSPPMVALVYALKQLDAALWMLTNDYGGEVEVVGKRLQDVAVYAKLAAILHKEGLCYLTTPSCRR